MSFEEFKNFCYVGLLDAGGEKEEKILKENRIKYNIIKHHTNNNNNNKKQQTQTINNNKQ